MAIGDIGATPIATGAFSGVRAAGAMAIYLRDDLYVSVYGSPSGGTIATNTIDTSGATISAVIDSLLYAGTGGHASPDIIRVSSTLVAVAYYTTAFTITVKTIDISSDGAIGSVQDTAIFTFGQGQFPKIVHVAGDVYGVVFAGDGVGGQRAVVQTLSISSSGVLTTIDQKDFLDAEVISTGLGNQFGFVKRTSGVYIIAYRGSGADGFIKTIAISDSGTITGTAIATFEFDPATTTQDCFILPIDNGDVFAVFYNRNSVFTCKTVSVSADGLTIANLSTQNMGITRGNLSHALRLSPTENAFAATSEDSGSDGFIITLTINDNGTMALIDKLEFDTSVGISSTPIIVGDNIVAIFYDNFSVGVILTFDLEGAEFELISEGAPPACGRLEIDNYVPRFGGAPINLSLELCYVFWQETINTKVLQLALPEFNVEMLALNTIDMSIVVKGTVSSTHVVHPLTPSLQHRADDIDLEEAAILWNKDAPKTRARLILPLVSGERSYEGVISRLTLVYNPGTDKQNFIITFNVAWNTSAPTLREWN